MKKLLIFVVLALFAVSCGGSDSDSAQVDATEETDTGSSTNSGDEDSDDSDDGAGAEDDVAESPDTIEVEQVQERECAHSAAELVSDDGAEAEDEGPVELPPAEKPDVEDDFLVPVDELIVTDLIVGTGAEALPGAPISMQYVGVLAEGGEEFDSSWDRGAVPFDFNLGAGQVISGWDEGIVGMKVGGRRVLQIPSAQAYGEQARGDVIGANADLVFIVDLIGVSPGAEPAPEIEDSNLGSFDELGITDLVVGEGCEAQIGDIVQVNYVGVNGDDGVEFDSSWGRGTPFDLIVGRSQVIEGWNDGIAGMRVGGERILQIPAAQAYDDGDLVFRVHLESLVEGPPAHAITFDGDAPDELDVTTLVEGSGDSVQPGTVVDANILVMFHNSGDILQSTWQEGSSTQLALQEGSLLPGLEEGIVGTMVGELRQIIVPATVAYPDGIPPEAGLSEDDALVFIIEPVRVLPGG